MERKGEGREPGLGLAFAAASWASARAVTGSGEEADGDGRWMNLLVCDRRIAVSSHVLFDHGIARECNKASGHHV